MILIQSTVTSLILGPSSDSVVRLIKVIIVARSGDKGRIKRSSPNGGYTFSSRGDNKLYSKTLNPNPMLY